MTAATLRARWLLAGWRRMRGNRLTIFGLSLLATLAMLALAAPLLPLADPHATHLAARMLPAGSAGHLLGTDQLGRDLLSRLVWGTRTSLAVGVFSVLTAALVGSLLGMLAGYFRGWTDTLLMRVIDLLLAFPYLLLALAIVAALGPGLRNAMIAIAVANLPLFARTVRGALLELTERDFIAAARLSGADHLRILLRELLPNVLPLVVVMIATNLGWMILETAGLSFLGLGAQPPTADLGSMLGTGREFLTTAPRVAVLPGAVILLLVVGINLVGDGLRDLLDPRLRGVESAKEPAPAEPRPEASPPAEDQALLRVDGLTTCFRHQGRYYPAIDSLGLSIAPGERVALVGESGCGKTVTSLSLLGLVPPPGRIAGGSIRFEDRELLGMSKEELRRLRGNRIGYIPQDPQSALNPVLTLGAQIVETLRTHHDIDSAGARQRAIELLDQVRIDRPEERFNAYPHQLSGGMRQRVCIAMALANEPSLIIADEATTALDVTVQAEILELLDRLSAQQGTALLFISHDLSLVAQLCSRVWVLYAGRVVEAGDLASVLRQPAHPYTRGLLQCAPELGRPDKALSPIPGQPPPLDDLPSGCLFGPRCAHAQERCRSGPIDLESFAGQHQVRCLRAGELS